jgi:hypothetical protein
LPETPFGKFSHKSSWQGLSISIMAFFALPMAFFAFLSLPADGRDFLGLLPDGVDAQRLGPEFQKALLSEIEEALGRDHRRATESRVGRIEEAVRSTFVALPKNSHGRLGHGAVRYALHRLFLQRHAWFVRGLEPGGEAWNASAPTAILQNGMPEYVQSLFEKRLGGQGFGLHELAVLAATLENMVRRETMQRLEHTYRILERPTTDVLSLEESHDLVDHYMASYIMGLNFTTLTPKSAREAHNRIEAAYPTWPETQKFLREVQAAAVPKQEDFTFENVASVVEEIGERYGRWQDSECLALKKDLVAIEDRGSGRVRLADFYGSAIHDGKWQFSESVAYLRQLGALDESEPGNLRVLIANYVSSPANCVASSSYYSVCCQDECDGILSHFETELGRHDATPGEIATLVGSAAEKSRTLTPTLLAKLEEVARHHGGRFPLHGRLFAQWMHQAYPRECPYPHVTGTTNPKRAEDYIAETKQKISATDEEMQQHAGTSSPRPSRATEEEVVEEYGMWTMQEELVVSHEALAPVEAQYFWERGAFRGLVLVGAVVSTTLALLQTVGSTLADRSLSAVLPEQHQRKYKV